MDDLKQKAGEQSRQLADKQEEADAALREITASMQVNSGSVYQVDTPVHSKILVVMSEELFLYH